MSDERPPPSRPTALLSDEERRAPRRATLWLTPRRVADSLVVLRTGDLRLLWLAQVVSQLGDGMFTVGVVLLMIKLTGSGLALSGTLIAQLLPYAVLGPAAGALADRWNHRLTMVGSDVVRGVVVLLIPIADLLGLLEPWMIPVVAFLLTSAGQFFDPARNALVPKITPGDELIRVNALLSGTRQVLFIGGPSLGGALIAAGGAMTVFWADGLSFFASAAVLFRMSGMAATARTAEGPAGPTPAGATVTAPEPSTRASLWADIRAGLRYVVASPVLRMAVTFGTLVSFLLSPLPVILPLFLKAELKVSDALFGTVLSVVFGGFLIGVTFVGVRGRRLHVGRLTIAAITLAGTATILLGLGPPEPAIFALGLVGGAAIGAMEVAETTILQRESSDELRGRVFSLYESVSQGGRAISVALAGGMYDLVGARTIFEAVGMLTLACGAALALSPSVRRLS